MVERAQLIRRAPTETQKQFFARLKGETPQAQLEQTQQVQQQAQPTQEELRQSRITKTRGLIETEKQSLQEGLRGLQVRRQRFLEQGDSEAVNDLDDKIADQKLSIEVFFSNFSRIEPQIQSGDFVPESLVGFAKAGASARLGQITRAKETRAIPTPTETQVEGLTPIFDEGKLVGFEDEIRKQTIPIQTAVQVIGKKRLARAGFTTAQISQAKEVELARIKDVTSKPTITADFVPTAMAISTGQSIFGTSGTILLKPEEAAARGLIGKEGTRPPTQEEIDLQRLLKQIGMGDIEVVLASEEALNIKNIGIFDTLGTLGVKGRSETFGEAFKKRKKRLEIQQRALAFEEQAPFFDLSLPAKVRQTFIRGGGRAGEFLGGDFGESVGRNVGEFLLFGLLSPLTTTAQVEIGLAEGAEVAFLGVGQTVEEGLIKTDLAFQVTKSGAIRRGLARGGARVVQIEEGLVASETIGVGGLGKRAVEFPTGKFRLVETEFFIGSDVALTKDIGTVTQKFAGVEGLEGLDALVLKELRPGAFIQTARGEVATGVKLVRGGEFEGIITAKDISKFGSITFGETKETVGSLFGTTVSEEGVASSLGVLFKKGAVPKTRVFKPTEVGKVSPQQLKQLQQAEASLQEIVSASVIKQEVQFKVIPAVSVIKPKPSKVMVSPIQEQSNIQREVTKLDISFKQEVGVVQRPRQFERLRIGLREQQLLRQDLRQDLGLIQAQELRQDLRTEQALRQELTQRQQLRQKQELRQRLALRQSLRIPFDITLPISLRFGVRIVPPPIPLKKAKPRRKPRTTTQQFQEDLFLFEGAVSRILQRKGQKIRREDILKEIQRRARQPFGIRRRPIIVNSLQPKKKRVKKKVTRRKKI